MSEKTGISAEIPQLFTGFKKACYLVRRKVLCNTVIEFGTPIKLVIVIKMCFNETYGKVWTGKHLTDTCLTQKSLKQHALSPCF
jgi:hypothetical protein